MTRDELKQLKNIEGRYENIEESAKVRLNNLAKPPGSLGILEKIAAQLAGITGRIHNSVNKSCIVILSADNGVVEEGVSSAPQSVTMAQTINFTKRLTGVGALAKNFGVDLLVIDMGINGEVPRSLSIDTFCEGGLNSGAYFDGYDYEGRVTNKIVNRKIRRGTDNLAKGPAMTTDEALSAIATGMEAAEAVSAMGYEILGVGEMGIGNTTTSAAILSAITGKSEEETVGKGGGITDASYKRKKEIVRNSVERFEKELYMRVPLEGHCQEERTLEILAELGGFDIAAMTGVFLGAAINRMPVVIDGYISAVAALCAVNIAPKAIDFMIPSHESWEQGYGIAIEQLGVEPIFKLNMRLGEGSGCPLAFQIVDGACAIMNDMATFEEASINDEYLEEIRRGDCF